MVIELELVIKWMWLFEILSLCLFSMSKEKNFIHFHKLYTGFQVHTFEAGRIQVDITETIPLQVNTLKF
jgi:hypothetical protein